MAEQWQENDSSRPVSSSLLQCLASSLLSCDSCSNILAITLCKVAAQASSVSEERSGATPGARIEDEVIIWKCHTWSFHQLLVVYSTDMWSWMSEQMGLCSGAVVVKGWWKLLSSPEGFHPPSPAPSGGTGPWPWYTPDWEALLHPVKHKHNAEVVR